MTRPLLGLCTLQVLALVYYAVYFGDHGYLPAPFVYDKSDTFMDFFHVMYWADHPGRYTDWGSIYPPINFLFMKALRWLFIGKVQFADAFAIRAYSPELQYFIVAMYLVVPAWTMTTRLWDDYSGTHKTLFYTFFALSAPMLFGIERGNLIVLCLIFVAIALASDGWRRLAVIALLINIKPYFAILMLAPIVAGRWSDAIIIASLAGAIFVLSGLLLDPNFLYFLLNLLSFSQSDAVFSGREVLALPSSVSAFSYVLAVAVRDGARLGAIGLDLSVVSLSVTLINYAAIAFALVSLALAGRRLTQAQVLAILLILISNLGVWVGGYSMLVYPLLVPVLMTFRARWVHLALLVPILLPLDLLVLSSEPLGTQNVYLSNAIMPIEYQLGLGTILRPVLNLCLLGTLSLEALARIPLPFLQHPSTQKVAAQ